MKDELIKKLANGKRKYKFMREKIKEENLQNLVLCDMVNKEILRILDISIPICNSGNQNTYINFNNTKQIVEIKKVLKKLSIIKDGFFRNEPKQLYRFISTISQFTLKTN